MHEVQPILTYETLLTPLINTFKINKTEIIVSCFKSNESIYIIYILIL